MTKLRSLFFCITFSPIVVVAVWQSLPHNRTPDGKLTPEAIARHQTFSNQMHLYYDAMSNDDETGRSYYSSTNKTDFSMLDGVVDPPSVSNMLYELNAIYDENKWHTEHPDLSLTNHYTAWRNIRKLQNSLYDLDAVPVFANEKWMNGAVLVHNGFVVREDIQGVIIALNRYEYDENPDHIRFDFKSATGIASKISDYRANIYFGGYRVGFDHRFNLWRLTEKLESDNSGCH